MQNFLISFIPADGKKVSSSSFYRQRIFVRKGDDLVQPADRLFERFICGNRPGNADSM